MQPLAACETKCFSYTYAKYWRADGLTYVVFRRYIRSLGTVPPFSTSTVVGFVWIQRQHCSHIDNETSAQRDANTARWL